MTDASEMQISNEQLASMTRDLDEMHQESMRDVRVSMVELAESLGDKARQLTGSSSSRRHFLMGSMAVAGVGALAACGSSSSGGSSTTSPAASKYTGDLKVVALAAALENLAIAGYGLALSNAGKGKYGKVPAAVGDFITVAMKQHSDHAAAWNSVLKGAGVPEITGTPLSIAASTVATLKKQTTVTGVATVALDLENAAAETYVFATANVSSAGGIATAASIAPVEAMHAAILSFVLGQYPVPNSNIGTTKAVQPSAFTG